MKTKWINMVVLATLVAGGLGAQDLPPKKKTTMELFMRQKLGYSEKVVEGITLEDYDLVITNGFRLGYMTRSNVWAKLPDPDFLKKTDLYRIDIGAMVDAAGASNAPAVLKAYAKVTADCVDCHRTFRSEQRATRH